MTLLWDRLHNHFLSGIKVHNFLRAVQSSAYTTRHTEQFTTVIQTLRRTRRHRKRHWKEVLKNINGNISGQFFFTLIPHFPQWEAFPCTNITIKIFKEQTTAFQGRKRRVESHCLTTCTLVAAALQVRPGSEFLSEKRHWRAAAPPGLPDAQPRLRTEELLGFRYRGCTETQKTGEGHCCTWPAEIQSRQTWEKGTCQARWGSQSKQHSVFVFKEAARCTWQGKACVVLWWQASKSAHPPPWHSASPTIFQDSRFCAVILIYKVVLIQIPQGVSNPHILKLSKDR